MKNYKDFEKIYIGGSDIANITVRYCSKNDMKIKYFNLKFNEDNEYWAHFVDEPAEIGAHYEKVFDEKIYWAHFIDDENVAAKIACGNLKIYRAGMMGCIVEFIEEK